MASSNICWGIEMGFGAIKAIKLEHTGSEFKVLDFAVINHAKVLATPEIDQTDAMRVALGTLVTQHDLSNARIAVSLPGHQSFARFAKLPPVEPKKVPDIVKFEAVQQIPFPLEEVEWDYQTFVSPDSPDVEVGIFAVTRQRIMDQLSMLHDVGLTPDTVTLSPIAAYNALSVDLGFTNDTPGTIILDIGTVATDLIIAEAGRVWVRTFPIGGHQFTEALVSSFKLSYSKAEKLKREAEQSKHARHVFQAMRPVFSDLIQEIQRSIGFYKSVHPDADIKRLVGLGSTFRLPGLRKYLKSQLQLDVYRLEQFKKISVDDARAGEFQAASFNLATAYGCVLQAFEHAPMQANLMPVAVIKTAMWKKKVPYFAAAAGLAAATAGAMFIRPLMDSTAFEGAKKPPVLTQVVDEATLLAEDAVKDGVTDSALPNLKGAEIVGLLSGRELYAQILEDSAMLISLVTESAMTAAESDVRLSEAFENNEPFKLLSLNTDYMTTGEGGSDSSVSSRGGRNTTNKDSVDPVLASIEGKRRIQITAQFEVPLADVGVFMLDHVDPKLRYELEREGTPYTLVVTKKEPWETKLTTRSANRTKGRRAPRPQSTGRGVGRDPGGAQNTNLSALAPIVNPAMNTDTTTTSGSQASLVTLTWYAVLDPMDDNAENGEGS
ncbi:MAG: type IV pilus assembly protein PilM [Phycisphaerales bacterium]|nr:type IV pilus assembly protein PilM [Phycisphaerales bacterium]